ncbi:MAG: AI-2E family transporter, partial [Tepidisphaeraceae bacterium]
VMPARGGMIERVQKAAEEISKASDGAATQATTTATSGERAAAPAGSEGNPLWVVQRTPTVAAVPMLRQFLTAMMPPLGTAGLVVVFTIFMLLAREDMRDRLTRLVGHGQLQLTTQALDDAAARISRYLVMQTVINATYAVAVTIGLLIIGVPNPVLWGLLCGVLRFVPYIGPWIGAAFPLAISLASFPGARQFVETAGLFIVVELLSNNVLEPWLYGSSTGMSTVAVLVSAAFWAWLWGPIGLLIATPLTTCVVVLGKYVPQLQFLAILLGDEPVLEPHERVYQRLLSGDQEEAANIVVDLLKQQSLGEVYDNVLMRTLSMTRQDAHAGRLDESRAQFVREGVREMADELIDHARANDAAPRARIATRPGQEVRVACLPARDEIDEIAGMLLGQLLDLRGYTVRTVSQNALLSEMLGEVELFDANIVCVSAFPPAAVAHARYLCKRIVQRFPDAPAVIGLWTASGDLKRARDRIGCSDSIEVVSSLAQSLERIHELAQQTMLNAGTQRETEPNSGATSPSSLPRRP